MIFMIKFNLIVGYIVPCVYIVFFSGSFYCFLFIAAFQQSDDDVLR